MGNQCCSAQTTIKDQSNAPIVQVNEPIEEGGETTIPEKENQAAYHATLQESAVNEPEQPAQDVDAQIQENQENSAPVSQYKFRKQLESLARALNSVQQLQTLSSKGQQLSRAISDAEAIISLFSQSHTSTAYIRDFKTDLIGLYGDLQGFRSFHLRYTLDDGYYNNLVFISDVLHFLKQVAANFTKDGKLKVEEFYSELSKGESHQTFEEHKQNLVSLRNIYNTIAGQNFSTLPNYLYLTFSQQNGFELWTRLFPNEFETSNVVFAQKYAEHCGVDENQILSIISLLDSSNDQRIDIYQWMEFVQENAAVLNADGTIIADKLDAFQDEIAARAVALQAAPVLVSEGQYILQSGIEYTGDIDGNNRKTGEGKLQEEGYELQAYFVDDLASGQGSEKRKGVHYNGDFQSGLYHGQGTLNFPNGRAYTGAFANHQFHGEGELVGDDGIKYKGTWKSGALEFGQITYHDGSYYIGQISKNFFKQGKGSLYTQKPHQEAPTLYIEGTWVNDAPSNAKIYNELETVMYEGTLSNWSISGNGKRIYVDGSYEGDLVRDNKQGQGALTYKNGDKFTGSWSEDLQTKGIYNYNKEKDHHYEGEWKNGVMEGQGKFSYTTGGAYQGQVKDGKRHGHGTYSYKNGNVYVGQWNNNNQEGEGKFTFAGAAPGEQGDVYQGQFRDGKFNGFGHYIYKKSGKQYIGFWEDDKWNGEGKFLDSNGSILKSGVWKNEKLEQEKVESDLKFPDNLRHLLIQRN